MTGKEDVSSEGFIKWFSELSNKDVSIAGGKGASLAEMYNNKFPIPPGFIVTAYAYKFFIEKAGLKDKIVELFSGLDYEDTEALEKNAAEMRKLIEDVKIPGELAEAIKEAYDVLDIDKNDISEARGGALEILQNSKEPPFVAVRSSATAEDLADASFAGQQDTFLNVKGNRSLISKVRSCFASLFTARATYYRAKKGFKHEDTYLAVVVQKMIDSDKSGVIFSKNPVGSDENILMEAVWGLGEGIVSGRIKPDQYIISSDMENFKILDQKISNKKVAITRDSSGRNGIVKLSEERSKQQVLSNYEIKRLAQYAINLEEHYKKPQDIEFAIENKEIYIVQSRPITTLGKKPVSSGEIEGEVLLSGLAASPGVASGTVRIVKDMSDLKKIKKGDILVTKMTNPDMVVTMQKASGIVTDEGGTTSHAAIVSREMGIPAIVGTGEATEKLEDGQVITVDGNSGRVFEGEKEGKAAEVNLVVPTKTKIKVIVDLPDFAERAAKSGVKGVGLTRIEGIIASSGIHPLGFVKEGKLKDYVEVLYQGLKRIAMPFEEVWVRTSDIRSDEYKNLKGAPKEVEGNPMLGDHGIRFGLKHKGIMESEITAIKELADEFPKKVFGIMMPQIISVSEVEQTKEIMEKIGMPSNIKLGVMIETPASVQIINRLCETGIKFISFGTNDLTQYTLAIDRNNSDVQDIFDEMNPAVLSSLRYVIRRCQHYNVETSICGQAGSRPEMAKFLVGLGINSISVNADAAEKISKVVAELERGVGESEEEEVSDGEKVIPKPMDKRFESPMVVPVTPEIGKPEVSVIPEGPIKPAAPVLVHEKRADTTDIEDAILQELEEPGKEKKEPEPESEPERPDEYNPGGSSNKNNDIPSLNDAIPIESQDFEEKEEEEEAEHIIEDLAYSQEEQVAHGHFPGIREEGEKPGEPTPEGPEEPGEDDSKPDVELPDDDIEEVEPGEPEVTPDATPDNTDSMQEWDGDDRVVTVF